MLARWQLTLPAGRLSFWAMLLMTGIIVPTKNSGVKGVDAKIFRGYTLSPMSAPEQPNTTPKRRGRPRLAKKKKKDEVYRFRLRHDDRVLFKTAAAHAAERRGKRLPLAAWLREVATRAAHEELEGQRVD